VWRLADDASVRKGGEVAMYSSINTLLYTPEGLVVAALATGIALALLTRPPKEKASRRKYRR
jgi:hypothetical protein